MDGVYVHIPFCAHKCYYCDFHSVVVGCLDFDMVINNYLVSLRREASIYGSCLAGNSLNTLFLGGGTPNLVPAGYLAELVVFLTEQLPFTDEIEITVEANPSCLSAEEVARWHQAGINRISLGAQAFQDSLLRVLGRRHDAEQVFQAVGLLQGAGINNINLDLLYGLPGQTMEQWQESLEKAVALNPTHLSCYNLIVEPQTPFAEWESRGLLDLPTMDLQADMYEFACSYLTINGFEHYEISNFAKPGFSCEHNLLYWHNRAFLGLGSGATGYRNRCRYTNLTEFIDYEKSLLAGQLPVAFSKQMSLEEEMDETMMVGMRLLQGVNEQEFISRYGCSFFWVYEKQIKKLLERGLVECFGGYLRVTKRGLLLENLVSAAFLRTPLTNKG